MIFLISWQLLRQILLYAALLIHVTSQEVDIAGNVASLASVQFQPPEAPIVRPGVIVLGMHRSGTSALCGLLVQMGFRLGGPLLEPALDNEKGFFERMDVVLQNDQFMFSQNVSYFRGTHKYDHHISVTRYLRSRDSDWFRFGRSSMAFLNNRSLEQSVGVNDDENETKYVPYLLKDPRLCITLNTWLSIVNSPRSVRINRDPEAENINSLLTVGVGVSQEPAEGEGSVSANSKQQTEDSSGSNSGDFSPSSSQSTSSLELNELPAIVFIYRHPLDVALSLKKREKSINTLVKGLRLWYVYNMNAVQQSYDLCRVIVSHRHLMNHPNPTHFMNQIYTALRNTCGVGITKPLTQAFVESFLDRKLLHNTITETDSTCHLLRSDSTAIARLAPDPAVWVPEDDTELALYRSCMLLFCGLESGAAFASDYPWDYSIKD